MSMIKAATAALFAMLLSIGLTMAPPAEAQVQAGLVNVAVDIDDVLSNNKVALGVAANIAANVCGTAVQVGVLAQQLAHGGSFNCTNNQNGNSVTITQ